MSNKFTVEFEEKGPGNWCVRINGSTFSGTATGANPVDALQTLLDFKKWNDQQREKLGLAPPPAPVAAPKPSHLRLVKKDKNE